MQLNSCVSTKRPNTMKFIQCIINRMFCHISVNPYSNISPSFQIDPKLNNQTNGNTTTKMVVFNIRTEQSADLRSIVRNVRESLE